MPEEKQVVTSDLTPGSQINPGDEKVDVGDLSDADRANQTQVAEEMTGEVLETAGSPDAESAGTDASSEIPTNTDYDDGYVNLDEDEEDEDDGLTEEEKLAAIKEEARREAWEEFNRKYKPNDQKGENIRLAKENENLKAKVETLSPTEFLLEEKKNEIYNNFFDRHRDVLSAESKQNLLAYQKSGDESFIFGDPDLKALNDKLQTIGQANPENVLVDLEERLENAIWLSHREKMLANATRQEIAKREMARQRVESSIESGSRASAPTARSSGLTQAQQSVFDAWGIKPN